MSLELSLEEKLKRVVKLLNICKKCYRGYMRHQWYNKDPSFVRDTKSTFIPFKCQNCGYSKLLRNPFCKEPSFDDIMYSGNAYSSEEMELDLFG
jgi:hypothetical protein